MWLYLNDKYNQKRKIICDMLEKKKIINQKPEKIKKKKQIFAM